MSVFKIPLKGCRHQNIDQVKKLINRSIFVQINSNILSSKWLLSNAFKNVDSTTKAFNSYNMECSYEGGNKKDCD